LACSLAAAAAIGCDGRGDVLIRGTIADYRARDSIFVSLTHNWEQIQLAPTRFNIQGSGYYELEFTVGRRPPPVTFVKNGEVYAKLIIHSLWEPSPVIIEEIRNEVFDVKVQQNGLFVAEVDL
jgi:hypothetical protein